MEILKLQPQARPGATQTNPVADLSAYISTQRVLLRPLLNFSANLLADQKAQLREIVEKLP
jgi:hypothetical protein